MVWPHDWGCLHTVCVSAHISEVFEDVIDDDLLRLIRVHSGEGVHVDDRVLESNQRKPQGAFQGLR